MDDAKQMIANYVQRINDIIDVNIKICVQMACSIQTGQKYHCGPTKYFAAVD